MPLLHVASGLLLALLALPALGQCPALLRIGFLELAAEPYVNGAGERFAEPPGLMVDWAQQAVKTPGCSPRLSMSRLPMARAAALLREGQLDLLGAVTRRHPMAAEFALPLAHPTRPEAELSVGETSFSLFATSGAVPAWDGQQLVLLKGQTVGVLRSSLAEAMARQRGWPVELAPSMESAVRKQLVGRSTVLLAPAVLVLPRHLQEGLVQLDPPLAREAFFLAGSLAFQAAHPGYLNQVWVAMCRLANGQRERPRACAAPP